jgi:hypothetical protein
MFLHLAMTRTLISALLLLPLIGMLMPGRTAAQFSDSVHHMVNLSAAGNFNRTNDGLTYLFNNSLKYGLNRKAIALNFNNKWVYGGTPEKLTNNDFNSALDFNLYKTLPHFYYWGLAGFTTSLSLKINEQAQGGLGAAYRLIDRENMMLSISDGVLYEYSSIVREEEDTYIYRTFRNSFRLQYRFSYRDLISFTSTGFYQPSLKWAGDYNISANAGISIKVLKWLSFSSSVTYNKVSRTGRENTLITYGLVAEHFF